MHPRLRPIMSRMYNRPDFMEWIGEQEEAGEGRTEISTSTEHTGAAGSIMENIDVEKENILALSDRLTDEEDELVVTIEVPVLAYAWPVSPESSPQHDPPPQEQHATYEDNNSTDSIREALEEEEELQIRWRSNSSRSAESISSARRLPLPADPEGQPIPLDDLAEIVGRSYSLASSKNSDLGNTVDLEDLTPLDVLKLFHQCKLDYAYSVNPSGTFFEQETGTPAVLFRNVDFHRDVHKPELTFHYRASASRDSKYESFQLNTSGSVTVRTDFVSVAAQLIAGNKAMLRQVKTRETVFATANIVCSYAHVNMKDVVTLSPKVLESLRKAVNESDNLSERYNKLMETGRKYGTFVVESCDLGARADCTFEGKAEEDMTEGSFTSNFKTAVALAGGVQFDGKRKVSKAWKQLTLNMKGPHTSILPPGGSVSDITNHANNIKNYDCVTIHSVTTIFDLIPIDTTLNEELRDKVTAALKWHESWSQVGVEDYWVNVQPLNFNHYSVWYERHSRYVKCKQFPTMQEANAFFSSKYKATIICKWDNKNQKAVVSRRFWGFNLCALDTVIETASRFYEQQLNPHGAEDGFRDMPGLLCCRWKQMGIIIVEACMARMHSWRRTEGTAGVQPQQQDTDPTDGTAP
jgi:hypothetical protein